MAPHEYHVGFTKRSHANRRSHVISENKERADYGKDAAMQRHSVSYAAHGMFSDPVVELSPFRLAGGESLSHQIRPRIASQISRP